MKFLPHVIMTVLYISFVAFVGFGMKWDPFSPNAIGDFLAGVFSPLAFYWFVLTAFLQRAELRETRQQFERQASAAEQLAGLQSKRDRREEAASIRSNIETAIPTIPDRIRKLSEKIESLPIVRNGMTGENLSKEQRESVVLAFPPHGISSRQQGMSASYAQQLRSMVVAWERELQAELGTIGSCWLATDDMAAEWIRGEWQSLLKWHLKLHEDARTVDDLSVEKAAEEEGLEDLRYAFYVAFPPDERDLWET